MSDRGVDDFNSIHLDILREIGNIGAGNATTALSKIINAKVDMGVPKVNILEFKNVADIIGGAESLVIGILVKLGNEVEGIVMFLMNEMSACRLLKIIMGIEFSSIEQFGEIQMSALEEIGNILASSYLNSLASLTGLRINPSVPYMSIDMAGAILSVPAIEFGKIGDKVLFIESVLGMDNEDVSGYFILVPELNSFEKILRTLGVM